MYIPGINAFHADSSKNRLTNQKKVSSLDSLLKRAFSPSGEKIRAKIHQVEHHGSHLASSFFVSPYETAALVFAKRSGGSA